MLNLTHLKVLEAVARHGSVTAAAKELHYSSRRSVTTWCDWKPPPEPGSSNAVRDAATMHIAVIGRWLRRLTSQALAAER